MLPEPVSSLAAPHQQVDFISAGEIRAAEASIDMIDGLISDGVFCEEQEQAHASLDGNRTQRWKGTC